MLSHECICRGYVYRSYYSRTFILCIKKGFNFQQPKATVKERIAQAKHSFLALLLHLLLF